MYRTDVKEQQGEKKKSPIKYYITFSGESGKYRYFNGEVVEVDGFDFVLVKVMSSITGWSDTHNARVYSNLVNSTVKEELVVRAGKEQLVKGIYANIKSDVESVGGVFTTNLFGLAKLEDEWVPVNVQLKGSGLAAWSEFINKEGIFSVLGKSLISFGCGEQKQKGKIKYFQPAFALGDLGEDVQDQADIFTDTELKPYLTK